MRLDEISFERDLRESSERFSQPLGNSINWSDTYETDMLHSRKFHEQSVILAEAKYPKLKPLSQTKDSRVSAQDIALNLVHMSHHGVDFDLPYEIDFEWCISEINKGALVALRDVLAFRSFTGPFQAVSDFLLKANIKEKRIWRKISLTCTILYLAAAVRPARQMLFRSCRELCADHFTWPLNILYMFRAIYEAFFASSPEPVAGIEQGNEWRMYPEDELHKLLPQPNRVADILTFFDEVTDEIWPRRDLQSLLREIRGDFKELCQDIS